MSEWNFTLCINQPLTREQSDVFDHLDVFADGSVGYVLGPEEPHLFPVRIDPDELRQLPCDVEAPTLLDAIAQVARDIQLVPGLYAVGACFRDSVTLGQAAQRCDVSVESLTAMARGEQGPGGFPAAKTGPEDGVVLYSWSEIAEYLKGIGESVPDRPRDLVVADCALRLAHELKSGDVEPGALRALGLPVG